MILLDTSGLLSALFPDQRHHEACATALLGAEPPLVMSPFVLAEVDYLMTRYADIRTEIDFLNDVAAGAYVIAPFGASDVARAVQIVERHRDVDVGLTDASIVVLAERHGTVDVVTWERVLYEASLDGTIWAFAHPEAVLVAVGDDYNEDEGYNDTRTLSSGCRAMVEPGVGSMIRRCLAARESSRHSKSPPGTPGIRRLG